MSDSSLAAAGGCVLFLSLAANAAAQPVAPRPVAFAASGSIGGTVQDEAGTPLVGARVSALGATLVSTLTDRSGHFELRTLAPGQYLVRAQLAGFVALHGQVIDVRASARATSALEMPRPTPVAGPTDGAAPAQAPP